MAARLLEIADKLDPSLRRAFLQAVEVISKSVNGAALVRAIEAGNIALIDQALRTARWPAAMERAREIIDKGMLAAGASETRVLATKLKFSGRFDIVNPLVEHAVTQHSARLITAITNETREAIVTVIQKGIAESVPPRRLALEIRPLIGMNKPQALAVQNARAAWAEEGLKGEALERAVARYSAKQIRRRAESIARTESIRAANEGQLAAWRLAADDGLFEIATTRRRWVAAKSERTCRICNGLHGKTVPFNRPFVSEVSGQSAMSPPIHPMCRCSVTLIFHEV